MIPLIPLKGIEVLPEVSTQIFLGRDFSINAAVEAQKADGKVLLVLQNDISMDMPEEIEFKKYGMLAKITNIRKMENGVYLTLIKGLNRIELEKSLYDEEKDIFYGSYKKVELKLDLPTDDNKYTFEAIIGEISKFMDVKSFSTITAPNVEITQIVDFIIYSAPFSISTKQKYLEINSLKEIIDELYTDLENIQKDRLIEEELNEKLKELTDDSQRKYFLREKLKIIKEELGEESDVVDELLVKITEASEYFPEDLVEKLIKEYSKLERTNQQSPEFNVNLNYIETLLSLPYKSSKEPKFNIEKVAKILDTDHYGLKEVKDAILEFISVMELKKITSKNNDKKAPTVLCLVGPPGIGKTSFASSIAKALKRKFSKISLGGVTDESAIRGHRKTYVGAMPGKIIETMIRVGVDNPVILLDEIDKMGYNFKGDPSSALLEVLDPSQNYKFEDHYVDFPYDLSNVMFICTANNDMEIPEPLYDRLEVIYLKSYTELEKLNIAKNHLLKQVKEETGIKLNLKDDVILKIINSYTREAGVRNLKRELVKLARKVAKEVLEKNSKKYTVSITDPAIYLGPEKYKPEKTATKEAKIGMVTGLAWTAVGGTTLEVQAIKMEGDGKMLLTGKLGEVMQESAKVAYSYVRMTDDKDTKFYKNSDIHIHFPEGAVPKDGPSAGITITTAIMSVVHNLKVRQDIAMTGEMTLTGEVLAVGGIKEKVIAAYRIGVREVVLPKENEVDTKELPLEILDNMKFNFVSNYEEVKNIVFSK